MRQAFRLRPDLRAADTGHGIGNAFLGALGGSN